jgi:hypothetical protein
MEDPCYAYLHCDLLDNLTIITLKVKSPYIEMHEQNLQKIMFVKVENFGIESKSKRGCEKGDMHVVITIESTTIVSWIPLENLEVLFKVGGLLPLLPLSLV